MASRLRPEARPLTWQSFTPSQQDAFRRIVGYLAAAVDQIPDHSDSAKDDEGDSFGPLDPGRSNNVIMLSGKRGTGKTSLLLTLYQSMRSRDTVPQQAFQGIDANLDLEIRRLASRVVWLETLDLEPLSTRSSLLSAILARIEDAAGRSDPRFTEDALWSAADRETAFDRAVFDFDRLANEMAIAWDDHPGLHTSSANEPEIFARDLRRAERARLRVRNRLESALSRLAKDVNWRRAKNPLFVVSIDDFDLNPPRALELLRLLRGIGNLRLFPIVLGDIEVARVILDIKMQGELICLHKCSHHDDGRLGQVSRLSKGLSAEAARKLLPPEQRLFLEPFTWEEALEFSPGPGPHDGGDSSPLAGGPTSPPGRFADDTKLGDLIKYIAEQALQELSSTTEPQPSTDNPASASERASILARLARLREHRRNSALSAQRYSGDEFFRGTPRELMDRWLSFSDAAIQLQQVKERSTERSLQTSAWGQLVSLIYRDLVSSLRSVERLPDSLRGELKHDDFFRERQFPPFRILAQVRSEEVLLRTLNYPPTVVSAQRFKRLAFEARAAEATSEFELTNDSRAGLVLMHDLLQEYLGDVDELPEQLPVITTLSERPAVTVTWRLDEESLAVSWPLPPFDSFYDAERFWADWNRVVMASASRQREFQNLELSGWGTYALVAGFATATRESSDWDLVRELVENLTLVATPDTDLPQLAAEFSHRWLRRLSQFTMASFRKSCRLTEWLDFSVLLLAPECAIPSTLAKNFVETACIESMIRHRSQIVAQRRQQRLDHQPNWLRLLIQSPEQYVKECWIALTDAAQAVTRIVLPAPLDSTKADSNETMLRELSVLLSRSRSSIGKMTERLSGEPTRRAEGIKKQFGQIVDLVDRLIEIFKAPRSRLSRDTESAAYATQAIEELKRIRRLVGFIEHGDRFLQDVKKHPISTFGNGILNPALTIPETL